MIQKVVVLGGGSAGFMAAIALKFKIPALTVRVIRSKDIGIIGVGEGSTGGLTDFLHKYLQIGLKKFHEVAQPTWKLGLRFIWGPRPYFNYTFGPGLEVRSDRTLPKANAYYCEHDIEYTDPYSAFMTHNRIFLHNQGMPILHDTIAYHFENEKFVRFLEGYAVALGVQIVEDTVSSVDQNETGITALHFASGQSETADLYIDASGFRSELLGKAFQEPFISYKSSLFCDRAIVGGWHRSESTDPEDQIIKPYTTCQTMDAGWSWQIEHETRINRGYVYSSDFISDERAEKEFREQNPRLGPTRIVKFISGRYQRSWVKNVVAIGNASGFVEPLEATALGIIAQQSRVLADSLLAADLQPRPTQRDMYNRFHALAWDAIRGFLAIHYKYNTRLDTPFWQHCREHTDLAQAHEVAQYYLENGPDSFWGETILHNPHDSIRISGYITMMTGMKVPWHKTYYPTEKEFALHKIRQQKYKDLAQSALTIRQTLDYMRSPKWKW
jgi:tryptophan halogenase